MKTFLTLAALLTLGFSVNASAQNEAANHGQEKKQEMIAKREEIRAKREEIKAIKKETRETVKATRQSAKEKIKAIRGK